MVLMVLILGKFLEDPWGTIKSGKSGDFYNTTLPPVKKEMHRCCVAGKAGIPPPGLALAPGQLGASHIPGALGMKVPMALGRAGTRTGYEAPCRKGVSSRPSWRCDIISRTRSCWSTSQQLLHPARADSRFIVRRALFRTAVLLFYPPWVHCTRSSFKTNGLWQAR